MIGRLNCPPLYPSLMLFFSDHCLASNWCIFSELPSHFLFIDLHSLDFFSMNYSKVRVCSIRSGCMLTQSILPFSTTVHFFYYMEEVSRIFFFFNNAFLGKTIVCKILELYIYVCMYVCMHVHIWERNINLYYYKLNSYLTLLNNYY